MRSALGCVLLAACGPSGSFEIAKRSYNADNLSATALSAEGMDGVDVLLASDEVEVRVTLLWPKESPPPLDKDISLGGDSLVALVRVGCFCGGKAAAFTEPVPSGKVRFSKLVREAPGAIRGELDALFKGQVALLSGNVLYDDETVRVRAYGFNTAP